MAKLLIRREVKKGNRETYHVKDTTQDYHCKHGKITTQDLAKPDGSIVQSHTGVDFILLTTTFSDEWQRLKRIPQSMIAKDIGLIITTCGLGQASIVIEAGSGNGSLTAQLANTCERVESYDVNEKHIENAKKNIKHLNLTNVNFHHADISDGTDLDEADAVILDLPQPWDALDAAHASLMTGGWLVTYSPSTTQVQKTKEEAGDKWLWIKTSEVIERTWKIGTRICRPDNIAIGHTAFLSFYRKL